MYDVVATYDTVDQLLAATPRRGRVVPDLLRIYGFELRKPTQRVHVWFTHAAFQPLSVTPVSVVGERAYSPRLFVIGAAMAEEVRRRMRMVGVIMMRCERLEMEEVVK